MHSHFYHWHKRAEFKPETDLLEPRWNAAKKFADKLPASDVAALLNTVLFPGSEPDFVSRMSEELVKIEPKFEPKNNAELVRVMATAAAYTIMGSGSDEADAVALGLQAAAFPPDRVAPVCTEIMERASEYLGQESERVRPNVRSKEDQDKFTELAGLVREDKIDETEGTEMTIAENVVNIGETVERLTEENQYLWWLVGRQSPLCKSRRQKLKFETYALVAAVEAEARVVLVPPAASVEALIEDAVLQCGEGKNIDRPLIDYVEASAAILGKIETESQAVTQLTPINSIRAAHASGAKVDKGFLKNLKLPSRLEVSAEAAATQYFRELVFLRALRQLG